MKQSSSPIKGQEVELMKQIGLRKTGIIVFMVLILSVQSFAQSVPVGEIKNIINQRFVENVAPLISGEQSLESIFEKIDDPYTNYFSPEQAEQFFNNIDNSFVGIGIYFQMIEEGVLVTGLIENGPAAKAGLLENDIIIRADQFSLAGLQAEQASTIISGPINTQIPIAVSRSGKTISYILTRERVTVPYVSSELIDPKIGYLRISTFGSEAGARLDKEIKTLLQKDVDRWILDVRDNPGGFLFGALDVLGLFLPDNTRIFSINENKRIRYIYPILPHQTMAEGPLIILQNRNSASASEITAAALQGYRKALVIGEQSFGKGSLQSFYPLSDGGTLRVTEERFLHPDGSIIDKKGVTPDLLIPGRLAPMAAELLLGGSGQGKKIVIKGQTFYINTDLLNDPEYREAYYAIIDALEKETAHQFIYSLMEDLKIAN